MLIHTGGVYHLHVVMNDPFACPDGSGEQCVLLVGISTHDNHLQDPTCILKDGDHVFIGHDSYVRYCDARVVKAGKVDAAIASEDMPKRPDVTDAVFKRIADGFASSPRVPAKIKRFITQFGGFP